ncbi:MAG: hypothetical protein WBD27_07810 [Pyrinomonadaceae bacterium]
MFEQELYNNEATQVESQDGDLFHNYEIRNWNYSTALYKILAISAVLNLAVLAFIGQTNLLTLRGCDSPFVGRVCQVLDMAYVGTVLFGTEREYVDMEYEKTDLGDAEITYIDVSGETPPLSYPEGYFQIANPVQHAMRQQMLANPTNAAGMTIPGFPMTSSFPNSDSDLLKTPPRPPVSNPNAFQDTDATTTFKAGGNGANAVTRRRNRGGKVTVTPTDDEKKDSKNDDSVAKTDPQPTPTVSPTGPVGVVTINREAMKSFGKGVAEKLDKKEVDLSNNFKVTAVAVLTDDGKFDVTIDPKTKLQRSRVLTGEGDPAMVKVVTEAIAAIGDSGWLGYLSNEGIKTITFTFVQNEQELFADIVSEQLSPRRAETMSKALTNAISTAFLADRMKLKTLGDDEKALLSAATATNSGKKVILNFKFPKAAAQEMIQRNIQKAREAETGKKINGQLQDSVSNTENSVKK